MDMKSLLQQRDIINRSNAEESQSRSPGRRTLNRFTTDENEWLRMYSTQCTAKEAGLKLGRTPQVIRKRCLVLGVQLKYSDRMANHTKPGTQRGLNGCPVS